jgi:uncharacterized protein
MVWLRLLSGKYRPAGGITDQAIRINLFVGSTTSIALSRGKVDIGQRTGYPWNGSVQIAVNPERKMSFPLQIRIPGWARNEPSPGNTYRYLDQQTGRNSLSVNGHPVEYREENGYAVIDREWRKGDLVALNLAMPVRRVGATDSVKQDLGQVALQRGPLIYCFEHADNHGSVSNIILPDEMLLTEKYNPELLQGVVEVAGEAPVVEVSADGKSVTTVNRTIKAIPYYSWANRESGEMQVWMPRQADTWMHGPHGSKLFH